MSEPTFWTAAGMGIVSSRTGWGPADTQILFVCGPTRESHGDRAQGSFLLSRDNTWLAGTAKLQSHSGIDQDAWDWCTLSVQGPNGPLPQTWTQDQAHIVRQEDTAQYTYVMADVAGAYQGQLSAFIRELFFLKGAAGGPSYLLVADGFIPVSPTSIVTWHLNTLATPTSGGTAFKAGQLYGQVIEPFPSLLSTETVTAGQDHPTYRVNLTGDSSGHFLVALEAAASVQLSGTTLGQPYVTGGVQGLRCGSAFVAWLSGDRTTWSYLSQTGGPHYLIGAPSTIYQTPAGQITSTAGGLIVFAGTNPGQTVTITKGDSPPSPPAITGYVPNPVGSGGVFSLEGSGFAMGATVSFLGQPLPVTFLSASRLNVSAPILPQGGSGPLLLTQGGQTVTGPVLVVNAVTPLPPVTRHFTVTIPASGPPTIQEVTP